MSKKPLVPAKSDKDKTPSLSDKLFSLLTSSKTPQGDVKPNKNKESVADKNENAEAEDDSSEIRSYFKRDY